MLKRVAVVAVALVGLMAAPAAAGQYPPANNSITVSDTTPTPGQTITVTVRTCTAGANVVVTLDGAGLGSGPAGSDGVLELDTTIPTGTALGQHTITAVCDSPEGTLTLSARIVVVAANAAGAPPQAGPGGNLPHTGSNSTIPLMQVGMGLAALGGVLLAASKKRRRPVRVDA